MVFHGLYAQRFNVAPARMRGSDAVIQHEAVYSAMRGVLLKFKDEIDIDPVCITSIATSSVLIITISENNLNKFGQ